MDYSQSGEQAAILEWAARTRRLSGRFLDVGAFDGTTASNTRALAERGWGGVAVEPAAWAFDQLATLYADHDDVNCVQTLVTVEPTSAPVRFHYSHDLTSTASEENAEVWRQITRYVECWVASSTVYDVLAAFGFPYDLVSVDTEGTSIEIFNALRRLDGFAEGALAVVEAEDGGERWQIQDACKDGWARVAVTPNNVLLERIA